MTRLAQSARMLEASERDMRHPMVRAIDTLFAHETPAQRWLRESGDKIRAAAADMDAEMKS